MSLALALLRSKLISSRAILIPLTKSNVITATIREAHQPGTGYWNKDWRPGPYPHTEEEKRAAAKKYGMLREDYEPYPDDGFGYGDYPKLPIVSSDERDSNEAYTQDHLKRNWGEPLHVDADLYGEDRFNPNEITHAFVGPLCLVHWMDGWICITVLDCRKLSSSNCEENAQTNASISF